MPQPRYFPLALLLLPLFLSPHLAAQTERADVKTFPVPASRTLSIDTFYGPIRLLPAGEEKITIAIVQTITSDDKTAADALLKNLRLDASTQDGQLNFTARYERTVRWAWEDWPPVKIATEVQIPPRCNLTLRARDGSITVASIQGNITLNIAKGDAFVGELNGNLTVETTQGNISVTACTGDLNLRTRSGSILVGRTGRSATINATDGEIEVQRTLGPLTVRGNRAPVKVGFPTPILNDATLSTAGEDLTVHIDPAAPCTLHAQAGTFGQVQLSPELPLQIISGATNTSKLSAHHLGGGALLTLKASGGNVRLKPMPIVPPVLPFDTR